jgi:hypothetical protein
MKQFTTEQLNDLLNRACEIITSLKGYASEHSHYPEHNRELQKAIDTFFNEIDHMNEEDPGPEYDSAGFSVEDRIVEGVREKYPANVEGSKEFNKANKIDSGGMDAFDRADWRQQMHRAGGGIRGKKI